ncbi:MAG: phosphate ABC transporter permease subunit PstC [Chloroflexota bacterium]|nr:phosphate ABC transporter permease subunit PstC [Chloroflexota bacterium]
MAVDSLTRPTTRAPVNWQEWIIEATIRILGLSGIGFVVLIFLFLLREGVPAFWEVPLVELAGIRWYPTLEVYGFVPLILGSLLVTIGAVAIAVPLGIAVAIFLSDLAPAWLRNILKPMIEVIAGIPSVVLGFLGIVALSQWIRVNLGAPTGLSAITGSLLLAYMALPTIISVAEDALDAVPRSYRDAALAMGATQWQTIWRVVLPAGKTGILTAVMLGVGRALGETMAVMMVTGNAPRIPLGLDAFFRPVRTMTATIAAEMGEVAQGSTHYHVLFAVGIVLFVLTFLINALAAIALFRQARRGGGRLLS